MITHVCQQSLLVTSMFSAVCCQFSSSDIQYYLIICFHETIDSKLSNPRLKGWGWFVVSFHFIQRDPTVHVRLNPIHWMSPPYVVPYTCVGAVWSHQYTNLCTLHCTECCTQDCYADVWECGLFGVPSAVSDCCCVYRTLGGCV